MCLFVCIHVQYMGVKYICMYVSICVSVLSLCIVPINECCAYMYVCINLYVCIRLYVCIHLYVYIHLYACLHLCVRV